MPVLHQIGISAGGVPKTTVTSAWIDETGVRGDHQADREHHGGPDRALCLYSLEVIERLRSEGHPIDPGSTGENLTIAGLDWAAVTPGTRIGVGEHARIEVVSYTSPCRKNARWFIDGEFTRMSQRRHPGESRVYARVLTPGTVAVGDKVTLVK